VQRYQSGAITVSVCMKNAPALTRNVIVQASLTSFFGERARTRWRWRLTPFYIRNVHSYTTSIITHNSPRPPPAALSLYVPVLCCSEFSERGG